MNHITDEFSIRGLAQGLLLVSLESNPSRLNGGHGPTNMAVPLQDSTNALIHFNSLPKLMWMLQDAHSTLCDVLAHLHTTVFLRYQ